MIIDEMKSLLCFLLCSLLLFSEHQAKAQVNVVGKPGAVLSPSAEWDSLHSLAFTFSYIPQAHAINNFMPQRRYTENIYSVSVPLTDFIRVNFNLTRLPEIPDRIGIGDRHMDVSFRLLKESELLPSLVLVISPSLGVANFMSQDLLVASKGRDLGHFGRVVGSVGYALPYMIGRPPFPERYDLPDTFGFHRKKDMDNHYLVGFFGSVKWQPRDFVALMVEHDSQKWNMGLMLRWKEYLSVQGHLLNGRDPAFTLGTRIPLDSAPFEMRRAK